MPFLFGACSFGLNPDIEGTSVNEDIYLSSLDIELGNIDNISSSAAIPVWGDDYEIILENGLPLIIKEMNTK